MTIKIDCYGWQSTSHDYFARKKSAVDVAESGNYTYVRFSLDETGPVHRIEESGGEVHVRWAYGAWTDRASLDFSHELNQPMDINA